MRNHSLMPLLGLAVVSSMTLAGCAGTPGLTTASVAKPAAAPVVDPACAVLRTKIADMSAADATVPRLELAADGKSKSVVVKRSALAAAAELNRLNSDYRARCSNPVLATQAAPAPVAAQVTAQAKQAATTTATAAASNAAKRVTN